MILKKGVHLSIYMQIIIISKHLFLLLGQLKPKFYVKHLLDGRTNVYINNPGLMTKIAAIPIYGKNLQKISPETVDKFQRNLA